MKCGRRWCAVLCAAIAGIFLLLLSLGVFGPAPLASPGGALTGEDSTASGGRTCVCGEKGDVVEDGDELRRLRSLVQHQRERISELERRTTQHSPRSEAAAGMPHIAEVADGADGGADREASGVGGAAREQHPRFVVPAPFSAGPSTGRAYAFSHSSSRASEYSANPRRSFREIGDALRDDKTFRHRYDVPYALYLENHRDKPLEVLEIGLGCDQERIGASVLLWEEYLPLASLTMIEFDAACGRAWEAAHRGRGPRGGVRFFYGDQADKTFLRGALQELNGREFDMIVDDGGHKVHQQIAAFEVLWAAVKRGGVYVIEDINSSFKTRYGGFRRPSCAQATATSLVKHLTDRVHALPVRGHAGKFVEDVDFKSPIARVDCHHFICFITKR